MHISLNVCCEAKHEKSNIMTVCFNQGQLCAPGDIWQCLRMFFVVTTGGRCPWLLVGLAGYYEMSHNTLGSLPQLSGPNVTTVAVHIPCTMMTHLPKFQRIIQFLFMQLHVKLLLPKVPLQATWYYILKSNLYNPF